MKNIKRMITLVVVLACIFSCFSLECFAEHGQVLERKNTAVNAVTVRVVNNGEYVKKGWFGKTTTYGTELTVKNIGPKNSEFKYTLYIKDKVISSGKIASGSTAKIYIPKGSVGQRISVVFSDSSNFNISYRMTVSGSMTIVQTTVNSIWG